jgi:DNA-binding beta-propeller fold protein YncE
MNSSRRWVVAAGLVLTAALGLFPPAASGQEGYEVWVIDQSDTTSDGGGTLYIYRGEDVGGMDAPQAPAERVDLGGAARTLCLAQTGSAPRRPHMFYFNSSDTHAVIAFVATGHVLFMDAATRTPVACVAVGVQAHAAVPSHDDTFVVVANQNGKLLQRIDTDYAAGTFTLNAAATLNLATCTTPSGAPCEDPVLRPNNRPICPAISSDDRLTFVTLAGGGLFVVDAAATPMSIVAEYDRSVVHPEGCGGIEARGRMYINSGGALEADLYSFLLSDFGAVVNAPNSPSPLLVYTHDGTDADSHGGVLTRQSRFLWVGERFGNNLTVVDTASNQVVNQFSLVGPVSGDPAPDLMAIAPAGNRVFMALRGPNPLTGNNPAFNNAAGSTPGVGILRVEQSGRGGDFFTRIPISHVVNGVERADPHGIAVRRTGAN